MKKYRFYLYLLLSSILSTSAIAQMPSIKDTGVAVNTQVPEISATDIAGNPTTIKQLSGDKGLILILFRSADWCPYCKRQLLEVNQWNTKFNELGYKVAAISYDSTETLSKFSRKKNLQYPLLADINHKTMEDLNVINDEQKPGDKHYGIPFPGVMVIDNAGNLSYKYFFQGYKKRVKMEQLYQQLKKGL